MEESPCRDGPSWSDPPGRGWYQGRRHDLAVVAGLGNLPIDAVAARSDVVGEAQCLAQHPLKVVDEFVQRLATIQPYPWYLVSARPGRALVVAAADGSRHQVHSMEKICPMWETFSLESRIRKILLDVPLRESGHHFGRPFLTAYQIAICFSKLYPGDYAKIGKNIGGKATGQKDSLAKYFANQLSRRIKSGALTDIEGRFLNLRYLRPLKFDDGSRRFESSLGPSAELSLFRIDDNQKF